MTTMTLAGGTIEQQRGAKVTYALALFDEASELVKAVGELLGHGIATGRISLLATDRELISKLGSANPEGLPMHTADSARQNAACPGWVDQLLVAADQSGPPRHRDDKRSLPLPLPKMRSLAEHLSLGCGAIVVRLEDGDEQVSVCETLLAHSRRGVQTHELRIAR